MNYIIYKTKNKVNKIYIGAHSTDNLNDGYIGSGKLLKKAIAKYGKDSFEFEVLHTCKTKEEMYQLENQIVNLDFVNRDDTYNLKQGGSGGYSFTGNHHTVETKLFIAECSRKTATGRVFSIESIEKRNRSMEKHRSNPEYIKKLSDAHKGKILSMVTRKKISDAHRGTKRNPLSTETKNKISLAQIGKIVSDETKKRQSESQKGKPKPHKTGTCIHCNREMSVSLLGRYHNDNCKLKGKV